MIIKQKIGIAIVFLCQYLLFNKYYFIIRNIKKCFQKKKEILQKENIIIKYENNTSLAYNKTLYHIKSTQYSRDYWEKRYKNGGNSGSGSYKHLATFKALILNNFIKINNISTVIEWGSGDCNQLSLANYQNYIGFDVSQTAINICKKKFKNDPSKKFFYMSENYVNDKKADLSLSLDVIYHILEDDAFHLYMQNLFNSSNKYVCIYSSNFNKKGGAKHVKHRKFTDWINKYLAKNWKLKIYIPNKYNIHSDYNGTKSTSDFFIYEKNKF